MITASQTLLDPIPLERPAGDYLGIIGDTLVSLLSSDNLKCVIWGVDALFPLICPLQVLRVSSQGFSEDAGLSTKMQNRQFCSFTKNPCLGVVILDMHQGPAPKSREDPDFETMLLRGYW